ncbi:MAG TPA: hypothetical protein VJ550_08975 [Geomonas sp.]|nr:hypothetical protein [Geomonas sp.]
MERSICRGESKPVFLPFIDEKMVTDYRGSTPSRTDGADVAGLHGTNRFSGESKPVFCRRPASIRCIRVIRGRAF